MNLDIERLAEQLAAKHRIPKSGIVHPKVVIPGDEFMAAKLQEPDYVPYCFGADCGRTRRTVYGFRCPTCGNQTNYDLTHYDGNKNVQYDGPPPAPEDALSGFPAVPGEYWKFGRRPNTRALMEYRAQHAERAEWNAAVDARKAAKKGSK